MVKLHFPDDDERPLGVGKYSGKTPNQIADIDPSYIVWMYDTINPKRCSRELYLSCEAHGRDDEDYGENFHEVY